MKKYLLLSILALAFMASCQNEELVEPNLPVRNNIEVSATLADVEQSRTQHSSDFTNVLWSENDAISVFSSAENTHGRYCLTSGAGEKNAKFQYDESYMGAITGGISAESAEQDFYVGVYPFMESTSVKYSNGQYEINTAIPATQKYAENSFGQESLVMVGVSQEPSFSFKNVGTILIFPLNGNATIKSATLVSGKNKIAGKAVVTVSADNNVSTDVSNGESEITLSCGEGVQLKGEEYTKFCFVLAPGVYDDLVVKFTDTDGNCFEQAIKNPNGKKMERSKSYNMPKMTFVVHSIMAKVSASMVAKRIIPSLTDENVQAWVENLKAESNVKTKIAEAITYISEENFEAAYGILNEIPGFEENTKSFTATGMYTQKVDYTDASTEEGKENAIKDAVQKALEKAREAAEADILNQLGVVNEANLTIGAFFKNVLSEDECKKFFDELEMSEVYSILLEFSQVIDYMITYQNGVIFFDKDFDDYEKNVDWWLLNS